MLRSRCGAVNLLITYDQPLEYNFEVTNGVLKKELDQAGIILHGKYKNKFQTECTAFLYYKTIV